MTSLLFVTQRKEETRDIALLLRSFALFYFERSLVVKKQGKKVCQITASAVQCYQCFSFRFLVFLGGNSKVVATRTITSYIGQLWTAADRCKKEVPPRFFLAGEWAGENLKVQFLRNELSSSCYRSSMVWMEHFFKTLYSSGTCTFSNFCEHLSWYICSNR